MKRRMPVLLGLILAMGFASPGFSGNLFWSRVNGGVNPLSLLRPLNVEACVYRVKTTRTSNPGSANAVVETDISGNIPVEGKKLTQLVDSSGKNLGLKQFDTIRLLVGPGSFFERAAKDGIVLEPTGKPLSPAGMSGFEGTIRVQSRMDLRTRALEAGTIELQAENSSGQMPSVTFAKTGKDPVSGAPVSFDFQLEELCFAASTPVPVAR